MTNHPYTLFCPLHGAWVYPSGKSRAKNEPWFQALHGACVEPERKPPAPPMKSRKR